jgi:site-specific DNA recombinase
MNKVRCAIYTRKSSEEGLEQDFNSLHAQREACAAYVLSQASEGWTLLPEAYDDGGISGGTLERPALQRLLADVAAGAIDIIVVYKVDRLTRSLLDFSRLVERFDAHEVSFVSVTQSFNTTTSMGRLTLNMLLSFAQFEREVTAERIRDKLAASKAKGMWMGGTPPLGYKPDGRSLAVIDEHAALVRDIYRRYLELGAVRPLAERLAAEGVRTPARVTGTGKAYGNRPFTRGQLYFILKNPIYAGDIAHKGKTYPGQHPAIIAREIWDKVQQTLADNVQGHRQRARAKHRSMLAGLIVDAAGEPMIASHASKGAMRYRYYASRQEGASGTNQRLPAREIEILVKEQVARTFDDPLEVAARLCLEPSPHLLRQITPQCEKIAHALRSRSGGPLADLVAQVRVLPETVEIELSGEKVAEAIGLAEHSGEAIILTASYRLTRTGQALRLIQSDGTRVDAALDPALIKLLVRARRWWAILREGQLDVTQLAQQEGFVPSYVTRVVRCAFLAPDIVEAALSGRQHRNLDAAIVRSEGAVPSDWREQRVRYLSAN